MRFRLQVSTQPQSDPTLLGLDSGRGLHLQLQESQAVPMQMQRGAKAHVRIFI